MRRDVRPAIMCAPCFAPFPIFFPPYLLQSMTVSNGRPVILRQAQSPALDVHPITGKLAIARKKKEKWKKSMRGVPPALASGFQPLSTVIQSLRAEIGLFDASPLAHETFSHADLPEYFRTTVAGILATLQLADANANADAVPPAPILPELRAQLELLVKNAQTRIFCDPIFGILAKVTRILQQNATIKTLRVYFEGAASEFVQKKLFNFF